MNNISIRNVGALGSLLAFSAVASAVPLPPQKGSGPDPVELGRKLLASRSARFVENKGQWNREAKFLAQSRRLNLWYTDHGVRFDHISPDGQRHQAVDMFFVGGHDSRPVGVSKLNSEEQIFHGKVSVTGIRSFREVIKHDVVPGVDMRGYFDDGKPRYDLIVAPGHKPSAIALGFTGANHLSVVNGALKVGTNFKGIFNGKPFAYQIVHSKRVPVSAFWTVAQNTARFNVGKYDPRLPLVIDPLVYGTYFGGQQGPDEVRAAVTDTFGGTNRGLFIVGSSRAPDYPATSLPFTDTLNPEGTDAFVARIATSGTATDFSVLIGGQGTDIAQFVKQNPLTGDLWFAGTTVSSGAAGTTPSGATSFNTFPSALDVGSTTTRRVIGDDVNNAVNFFVGRFTHFSDGSLSFGTDGVATDSSTTKARYAVVLGSGIANAAIGTAYITGFDISSKVDGSVQMAFSGVSDASIARRTNALISNSGNSTDGYLQPGHRAGFLLRFAVSTTSGVASANAFSISNTSSQYVTGTRVSELRGVALDGSGNAYVAGTVYDGSPSNIDTSQNGNSSVFYTTGTAPATSSSPATTTTTDVNGTTMLPRILRATDMFVRIYSTYGLYTGINNIAYSGFIGGNGDDEAGGVAASLSAISVYNLNTGRTEFESLIPIYTGSAIAIDADGNMYVTGTTRVGPNFPHTAGAFGGFTPPPGAQLRQSDVFVARLSTGGTRLDYAATLAVNASSTPSGYGQATFTTAMPAGIAVDPRGYVYVTGNLRPYDIIFPSTYTTLSTTIEPGSSSKSTIDKALAATSNTIDTDYDFPTAGPFPSTEAFLVVLNPSFSSIQFASYIGGVLDDLVYAPSLDASGNVLIVGWTDGGRIYDPPFRTTADYLEFDGSLNGKVVNGVLTDNLISGNAAKTVPDTNVQFQSNTFLSYPEPTVPIFPRFSTDDSVTTTGFGYNIWGTQTSAFAPDQRVMPGIRTPTTTVPPPPLGEIALGRDGYVVSIGVNLPAIVNPTINLAFDKTTIPALGTATGTVTLSPAQPLKTTVRIILTSLGTLQSSDISLNGPNDPAGQLTNVVIPSGSTTGTFTVKSNTVGRGGTVSFTASIPSGTATSTSSASVTIQSLNFSLTLNPTVVVGSSTGTSVGGTVTLANPAPTSIGYVVTIPNTTANRALFNVGTSNAFATVDATNNQLLDLATGTVPSGATTGTFTFRVGSPSAPTVLIVTASTVATSTVQSVSATSSLTVNPVGLVSIGASKTTIRSGRDQLVLNVTFNGPVSSADAFSLTYGLGGVFPPTTSSNPTLNTTIGALTFVSSSNGQYTYRYTANSNRLSRSQDVSIVATYKGTTASTSVTVVR